MSNGKDVVVRTSGNLRNLQYEAWVESRRELVKNYSNGKLGYIHIRGMNAQSFESFERELKASGYENTSDTATATLLNPIKVSLVE